MDLSQRFSPVDYSVSENKFLLAHLGEQPILALQEVPPDVVVMAVKPVIDRVYELNEKSKVDRSVWVGTQAIKDSISLYLFQLTKWKADAKRGAPSCPPMYSFDSKGKPHRGGIGSDSGVVKTYFDKDGSRHEFAVNLFGDEQLAWTPEWHGHGTDEPTEGLKVDAPNQRIECMICGHTEHYNLDSRASYNAARARISKHLRKATTEPERHREVYTNEFHS